MPHEGTKIVKKSKLYMLTSGCEEIRTREDGIFNEFYAKFNDIVNLSFLPSKKLGLQFFEIHQ